MNETQIITAIITGVFGLITAIVAAYINKGKKEPLKYKLQKTERLLRKTLFVLIVIVLVLSSLLAWSFYRPVPSAAFVRITYPLENAYVNLNETIQGVSQNVPQDQEIWIVVYLDGYRYYPAETLAAVQSNGDWSSFVWIGEQKDVGRSFYIYAVAADKNAQNSFNAYVTESINTGIWPGLKNLPEGALNSDTSSVHVIRK